MHMEKIIKNSNLNNTPTFFVRLFFILFQLYIVGLKDNTVNNACNYCSLSY